MKREAILGAAILMVIWQALGMLNLFNPIYFATPLETALEFFKMVEKGSIFLDAWGTLRRVLVSVMACCLVAIPLGVGLGLIPILRAYLEGPLDFFRSIPPIVFFPLLLIVMGPHDAARISVAVIGGAVVVVLVVSQGLALCNPLRRRYLAFLGAGRWAIFRHVIFFEALPAILTSLRALVSLSLIIIMVSEMLVGASHGLGTRVQNVQITSNVPDLFATLIITGLIGTALNKIIAYIENRFLVWKL